MYFFHENLVQYAIAWFNGTDFATPDEGDAFWRVVAPGNTTHFADRPFERFNDYEEMLLLLRAADAPKYERMHKGTPFYLMSWLAFDMHNYEKALFYIDAAISEDVRKTRNTDDPQGWKREPGAGFLLLDPRDQGAQRTIHALCTAVNEQLNRFNAISQKPPMDLEAIRKFVTSLIADASKRTIVSALYVVLLEFGDRTGELNLRRGSVDGSNAPFTIHLFTGGLLFESLLKHFYPVTPADKRQLGQLFRLPAFQRDFGLAQPPDTSADTLQEIYDAIANRKSVDVAFSTAAKLRNTTGHNLVWDNLFSDSQRYTELFQHVVNAIFHVIATKG
jgi:hypothetical protein